MHKKNAGVKSMIMGIIKLLIEDRSKCLKTVKILPHTTRFHLRSIVDCINLQFVQISPHNSAIVPLFDNILIKQFIASNNDLFKSCIAIAAI